MQDTGGRISNQQKKSFTHFKKAGAKKRGGRIERYGQRNNKTTNEQKHFTNAYHESKTRTVTSYSALSD